MSRSTPKSAKKQIEGQTGRQADKTKDRQTDRRQRNATQQNAIHRNATQQNATQQNATHSSCKMQHTKMQNKTIKFCEPHFVNHVLLTTFC